MRLLPMTAQRAGRTTKETAAPAALTRDTTTVL